MLLVIETVGYIGIARLWSNTEALRDSYAIIDRLSEVMSAIKDAETGQRGYLLTGNETYLEPYTAAQTSIYKVANQLRDMTANQPTQARRLEQALALIQSKMAELKTTIDLRRNPGFDAAAKVVDTNQGQALDETGCGKSLLKWIMQNEFHCTSARRRSTLPRPCRKPP